MSTANPLDKHHKNLAVSLLKEAPLFFQALKDDFKNEYPIEDTPESEAEMVKFFGSCQPDQVQELFYMVRRALKALGAGALDTSSAKQNYEAALELYFLAAFRLVNKESHDPANFILQVPSSENVFCAIISSAMFGGTLRLNQMEQSQLPSSRYVFEIHVPASGDTLEISFERALHTVLFQNAKVTSFKALDNQPLSADELNAILARLEEIKHVQRECIALIVNGYFNYEALRLFANKFQIPVMIKSDQANNLLIGMSADNLISKLYEFLGEINYLNLSFINKLSQSTNQVDKHNQVSSIENNLTENNKILTALSHEEDRAENTATEKTLDFTKESQVNNNNPLLITEPVAEVKDDLAANPPLSRLDRQLQEIIAKIIESPQFHNHPFLLALIKGKPPVALAEIYGHCCESDPSDLFWDISAAVKESKLTALAENGFGIGLVSDLIAHMCLIAAARWISEEKIGTAHWVNDLPNIAMTEELAAAAVAATWFDVGLQLRYNTNGKIEVANLICDRAETQFGVKTIEQAIDDEIFARVTQELSVNSPVGRYKPHPRDVKAGINRLEKITGARLMVGLGTADARQGVDGTLRNRIQHRWGIELFVFGDKESHSSGDIQECESIEDSLLGHFERILSPLFLDSNSSTETTTGNSMPRQKVFISYAHKDEKHRKYLVEHLQVLENQQLIDIWDDRSIGAGQNWYDEINRELQSCKVAVFLVSPAFLGSKFITNVEVPKLLERHQQQGMHVLPLLIRDCSWEEVSWLKAMQIRPAEAESLSNTQRKRDQQLKQVALEIAGFVRNSTKP